MRTSRTTHNNLLRLAAFATLLCAALASAQTPTLNPGQEGAPVPVVTFDFEHPSMRPSHFAIAVDSTGKAAYMAEEIAAPGDTPSDPYMLKFTVSEPTRSRIFELARQVNYFNGNFDYTKTRIANTGMKTLTYMEGHLPNDLKQPVKGRQNQTTYNWSDNTAIQELTKIFQGIAATLEAGRRLEYDRRFDKLGLTAELRAIAEDQKNGRLEQVQAIAPTLRNIANDYSVMHIARDEAKKILAAAGEK